MSDILRIKRFNARPVLAPMKMPLRTSSGAVDKAPLVLIDCETDHGDVLSLVQNGCPVFRDWPALHEETLQRGWSPAGSRREASGIGQLTAQPYGFTTALRLPPEVR